MRKYDEIMEHLVVTEEMKQRILSNVNEDSVKKKKIVTFTYQRLEYEYRCLLCGSRSGSLSFQKHLLDHAK